MTIAARIIGTYSRVSRGSSFGLSASVQKSSTPRALHRALHAAGAAVVGGERQVPVAVEHARRASAGTSPPRRSPFPDRTARRCTSRWRRPFSSAGAAHELPDALGLRPRQRVRLERALDQRHVGEVERQPFGAEDVLNHRQVLAAALHALLDEVVQPALEQLDVREHPLVQRDRDVVAGRLQVRLDRRPSAPGRRRAARRCVDSASSSSIDAGSYFFSVKPSPSASALTS